MCETKREGTRETKRDNYIYCDVTNVVAYLKNHIYITPKGTSQTVQ